MYNRNVIEFLFHDAGFREIESGTNEQTAARPLIDTVDMDKLQGQIRALSDSSRNKKKRYFRKDDSTPEQLQETLDSMITVVEQVRQLRNVFYYLFPPREYYVIGVKRT